MTNQGFKINISKGHANWLAVSELISLVQKPVSTYVGEIIKNLHEKLCKCLLPDGQCSSPDDCKTKTKPTDLCRWCKRWYEELGTFHKKGTNPTWYENCNTAKWSEDPWELAKFFMPPLGSHVTTVKDAKSTDLLSLLNVLEWIKDAAFPNTTRVNLEVVRKLRCEVTNTLAHPRQLHEEFSDYKKAQVFSTAIDFLADLEKVSPNAENKTCLENLAHLNTGGVTNVVESELKSLLLQLRSVDNKEEQDPTMGRCLPNNLPYFVGREEQMKEAITYIKDEQRAHVSLHGGPGIGKTVIATEISHKLDDVHKVIFCHLASATTEDEAVRQICYEVGIYNENDPKSSLFLCLKNISGKVVFVLDNVDNLLEKETSSFSEFVGLLYTSSNQHCQIVTTSRTSYEIPELSTGQIRIEKMDDEASIELLSKQCPKLDRVFLKRLAQLCGNIPLAMCIAGSRVDDFEHGDDLLEHLKSQGHAGSIHPCLYQAINMSYEKCTGEVQESFLRLAVFEGTFDMNAAQAVIEKDTSDSKLILDKLVRQSLIKQPTEHRFSLHIFIKQFLRCQVSENENDESAREKLMRAEFLMIKYYLNLGHQLTMQSYSKDGYKLNKESLKQESHNVQNVLKICCQLKNPIATDISECLARSKVYTTSGRHFSLFVRTIVPEAIVDEFLQRCSNLANERGQYAIKIDFDCLLADRERSKAIGKSDESFVAKMEEIKKEYEIHCEDFKKNTSLSAHYYYMHGEYLSHMSKNYEDEERLKLQVLARQQLEESLKLREKFTDKAWGIADIMFLLLRLGIICKLIFGSVKHLRKEKESKKAVSEAKNYLLSALYLSRKHDLGKHELTSACYKNLGDTFLDDENLVMAELFFTTAKRMWENLRLVANESHVLLLNNLGKCLTRTDRVDEAIELLENARDIVEKLAESFEQTRCKVKIFTSLAIAYHSAPKSSRYQSSAVKYAKKALDMKIEKCIRKHELRKLQQILQEHCP